MMGEGALLDGNSGGEGGPDYPWGRRGSNDDEEEEF